MKGHLGIYVSILAFASAGCSSGSGDASAPSASPNAPTALIVFAQANSKDPWRQVFDGQIKDAAALHASEFQFEMQQADDDANVQIGQIETLMVKSPKVLLISPTDKAVSRAVQKVFDAGIPVILLDRAIEGEKYTCWIGGDNVEIGRRAAEFIGAKLGGKGTVLMIPGLAGATATDERASGAMEVFRSKYPGIKIIEGDNCDYQRQKARAYMETFLQSARPFDAVYAHNDEMAIGTHLAMEAVKAPAGIIVGVDACQQEVVDFIKAGKITATFQYPTPGAKGIEIAAMLLKGQKPESKRITLPTVLVSAETADAYVKDNPNLAK